MTLEELKNQCIRIMHEESTDNIDESFMLDSINRALLRLDGEKKIPITNETHSLVNGEYMFIPLTEEVDVINIPTNILSIVPYFVKGELYEEDDYTLSAKALNMFESYLTRLSTRKSENMPTTSTEEEEIALEEELKKEEEEKRKGVYLKYHI